MTGQLSASRLRAGVRRLRSRAGSCQRARLRLGRVFVAGSPIFLKKINSGKRLLLTPSNAFTAARWALVCSRATTDLYIKVFGLNLDAPKGDLLKKFYSPVVTTAVQK